MLISVLPDKRYMRKKIPWFIDYIYKWCRVSCEHEITLSQLYHYHNITRKLQTVECKDQWSLDRFDIDIISIINLAIDNSIIFLMIFFNYYDFSI